MFFLPFQEILFPKMLFRAMMKTLRRQRDEGGGSSRDRIFLRGGLNLSKTKLGDNYITEGPIGKGLLAYFFPIFVGSLFQQLYNTVDAVIVGKFVGTEALAAVGGSAGQIAGIVFWLLSGIASGATVTVSQHFGAEDYDKVHRDVHNGILLSITGSLLFTGFMLLFSRPIFILMKTPEDLLADSLTYIYVLAGGLTVSFLFNMGSGILRALGDSRRPLIYLVVCCFTNIFLDLLFVIVFEMGILGAAIATVIAQTVSAVLVLRRLMKLDERYALRVRKLRFYKNVLRVQLRIGLPGGFQSALYGVANIIIQTAINALGTATVAANTAFSKLDSVFWLVSGAFGTAVTTYVGQNYGAGSLKRVKKSALFSLLLDGMFTVMISAAFFIFSVPLLKLFVTDEEVLVIGEKFMRTVAPFYIAYDLIEIFSGALRGLGNVLVPTVITLGGVCVLRVLWIYFILPMNETLETLIAVFPVSWIATGLLFVVYFILFWRKFTKNKQMA